MLDKYKMTVEQNIFVAKGKKSGENEKWLNIEEIERNLNKK